MKRIHKQRQARQAVERCDTSSPIPRDGRKTCTERQWQYCEVKRGRVKELFRVAGCIGLTGSLARERMVTLPFWNSDDNIDMHPSPYRSSTRSSRASQGCGGHWSLFAHSVRNGALGGT